MISLLLSPFLGWFVPRWWIVLLAATLPVLELWISAGLDSYTRDGYENWGLVITPFFCVAAAGIGLVALLLRRRRDRRRGGTRSSVSPSPR